MLFWPREAAMLARSRDRNSVRLSTYHTRALWWNESTYCRYFDTTWKGNHCSFMIPTEVGGRCPLPPEICAKSCPPPLKNADFDQCLLIMSEPYELVNRKSTTRFLTSYAVRTLPLTPHKGGSKTEFDVFVNNIQTQSNKVCYKVSLSK